MMNLYFTKKIALSVLTGVMYLSASAQCNNQLVNGGFEIDATTGWTTTNGGDGFAQSGTSRSGSYGLKGSYIWSSQVQVIDLGSVYNSSEIRITNLSGKLIYSKMVTESKVMNLSLEEPAGIYFISIQSDDNMNVIRLLKVIKRFEYSKHCE